MANYDPAETFATEEGVFREAQLRVGNTSEPSDLNVRDWARDTCKLIVEKTRRAGAVVTPPWSTVDAADPYLAGILRMANEVGAAYELRCAIARRTGHEQHFRQCEGLAQKWSSYMGEGSIVDGTLDIGEGGIIGGVVGERTGIEAPRSDVTSGDVELLPLGTKPITSAFVADQVD